MNLISLLNLASTLAAESKPANWGGVLPARNRFERWVNRIIDFVLGAPK